MLTVDVKPMCSGRILISALGALFVTCGLGAWVGFELGLKEAHGMRADNTLSALSTLFRNERLTLTREKESTQMHLDALALRLGQMQGELLRLNALGERLVQMAELDTEEFDFTQPPPLGGPEDVNALAATVPDVLTDLADLARSLEDRQLKLDLLEDMIMSRNLSEQTIPSGKPVKSGWVSSHFGTRKDPYTGKRAFHRGLDFVGKRGSEIVAVADGLVVFSGYRAGFGRMVEIRHGNGYVTRYAHNQKLLVKEGELARQGQTIATLGSSGRATGPHLHFEVLKDGKPVNPRKYVETENPEGFGKS
jgi:murein DD-endopeptidase MepM/ murein hydrolase activator NlpD